jgi:aspartate aminotransferase
MNIQLSKRIQRVKPSPTLSISTKAQQLMNEGKDIINLSVGEPDFDTPEHIKLAAIDAIHSGQTRYTAVAGTLELRKAIVEKFKRDNQLTYLPHQIVVTCGAKQAIFNAMQALLNADDEVIIPAPYWVSYADMALVAEATPIFITAGIEQDFKISPQQLEAAITPKTRMVLLNSPSNPTGVAYSETELLAFAHILKQHPNIIILSDDIYEKIYWAASPFCNILSVAPELKEQTIVINGVSKTYAMTGWRIGYAAGPDLVIKAMNDLQSHSTSNACSIAQAAALAAISGDQSCLLPMVKTFKERHDFAHHFINQLLDIQCLKSDGAFYLFPHVENAMIRLNIASDIEFSNYLLSQAQVAVVPGSAFGMEGYLRLSTALSQEKLEEALKRIEKAIV